MNSLKIQTLVSYLVTWHISCTTNLFAGGKKKPNIYTPGPSKSGADPHNSVYPNLFSSKRQKYRCVELHKLLALKDHCDWTGHTSAEVDVSSKTNVST